LNPIVHLCALSAFISPSPPGEGQKTNLAAPILRTLGFRTYDFPCHSPAENQGPRRIPNHPPSSDHANQLQSTEIERPPGGSKRSALPAQSLGPPSGLPAQSLGPGPCFVS
jgi:hypothetical protein